VKGICGLGNRTIKDSTRTDQPGQSMVPVFI
jgi:hypothetical protein